MKGAAARQLARENTRLREQVAYYRALVLADDAPPEFDWMGRYGLTGGESIVFATLMAHATRPVSPYVLDDALDALLPSRRQKTDDSDLRGVYVAICKLRRKLPDGAIETIHGRGWRISPTWQQ